MPIRSRIGPLTIRTGPARSVVASTPWMLKLSVQTACTAAITTGRYSGRQPAITALIAIFSTVAWPMFGGTTAIPRAGLHDRRDGVQAVGEGDPQRRVVEHRGGPVEAAAQGPAAVGVLCDQPDVDQLAEPPVRRLDQRQRQLAGRAVLFHEAEDGRPLAREHALLAVQAV